MVRQHVKLTALTLALCTGLAMAGEAREQLEQLSPVEAGSGGRSRDILSCPFDELSAAYTSIYTDIQHINAAAIYSEVLNTCVEIQGQVKEILNNEQAVRDQLKNLLEPARVTRTEPDQPRQSVPRVPEPDTHPEPVPVPVDLKAAKAEELESARRVDVKTDEVVAVPFQIVAILSSPVMGPGLNAVLVDVETGEQRTVREGQTLPGGARVDEITHDGVMVLTDGEREPLVQHPGVPKVSDGGGLIPEEATVSDLFDPEIVAQ